MTNIITSFDNWLGKDVTGWWIPVACLIGILVIILCTFASLFVMNLYNHPLSPNPSVHVFTTPHNKTTEPTEINNTTHKPTNLDDDSNMNTVDMLSLQFVGLLVWFAFREEVVFRLIPLTLMMGITYAILDKTKIPFRLIMLLGVSVLFGYIHGGFDHLLVQGFSGFMFGVIYMKCGGSVYESNYKIFRGILSSTFVHYSVNFIFSMMTVFMFGTRYFGLP